MGFSFPAEYRLHAAKEFSSVFATRCVIRSRNFSLHYFFSNEDTTESVQTSGARLGIVVAKRLARLAVQRNLLKRIAREAFRNARPRLPQCDLVLRLSKPTITGLGGMDRKELRQEIEQLMKQLPACKNC